MVEQQQESSKDALIRAADKLPADSAEATSNLANEAFQKEIKDAIAKAIAKGAITDCFPSFGERNKDVMMDKLPLTIGDAAKGAASGVKDLLSDGKNVGGSVKDLLDSGKNIGGNLKDLLDTTKCGGSIKDSLDPKNELGSKLGDTKCGIGRDQVLMPMHYEHTKSEGTHDFKTGDRMVVKDGRETLVTKNGDIFRVDQNGKVTVEGDVKGVEVGPKGTQTYTMADGAKVTIDSSGITSIARDNRHISMSYGKPCILVRKPPYMPVIGD
ncbi:MAG: hypothetical protein K2X77_24360 [Candidatus Obscuribacterales bacterium]|nr:hypothetical protein [Candidatus Obscuribacterales bacterium]